LFQETHILLAFLVACALSPSFNSLIAFRFLSGLFGSTPLTNGGGTIADMIRPDKRAAAMGAFAIGPLLGPIIGPVAGGFVADNLGWRWVFWILAILSGSFTILFFIVARETYAPVLLQRRVDQLRKETGNMNLRSKLDEGLQPRDYFKRGIIRPFKLMAFSPICIFAAFYVGVAYGYLYLLFVTLTPLFTSVYGFSSSLAGLCFLGLGVGSMIGVVGFSLMSDRYTKTKQAEDRLAAEAAGREPAGDKPEYRLPALIPGSFALPAGLFIYGWTAKYAVHWIVPILGTTIVGFGNILIFMVRISQNGQCSQYMISDMVNSRCKCIWLTALRCTRRPRLHPTPL
jgi:MFS family permease